MFFWLKFIKNGLYTKPPFRTIINFVREGHLWARTIRHYVSCPANVLNNKGWSNDWFPIFLEGRLHPPPLTPLRQIGTLNSASIVWRERFKCISEMNKLGRSLTERPSLNPTVKIQNRFPIVLIKRINRSFKKSEKSW